jgi:hypothetical protein
MSCADSSRLTMREARVVQSAASFSIDGIDEERLVTSDDLPKKIGAPATRALASIGVTRLDQLADHSERELLALHGFGRRALEILRTELADRGMAFTAEGDAG